MNCIKCGVKIQEPQVFCGSCLKEMEKYPVKPNIQVTLPVRPKVPPAKKRARRQRGSVQDEQMRQMKIKLRLAHTALIVILIAFLVVSGMMFKFLTQPQNDYAPGQNYGTMPSAEPT